MKLLAEFKNQLGQLGVLKHVWLTSFNISIEFIEKYVLPAVLDMETPRNRMDYEHFQLVLAERNIDFRVFCDRRFMLQGNQNKRTAIHVHGISPGSHEDFSQDSLFHPKVIYLEDVNGKKIIGAGSANLTISGWGRNQEVFCYYEIGTSAQYRSVKDFFNALFENIGLECPLPIRRSFSGKDQGWTFVHSFQEKTFLQQLFADVKSNQLAVWSPYFPKDLVGYIGKLKKYVGINDLEVALVPDRVDGKYIRTSWNNDLATLVKNKEIAFYANPTNRHDNVDLCHAKVWKVPGKLAIGSWNFTGPGSNNLLDENDDWDKANNIEAGFLIEDGHSWKDITGKPLPLSQNDFASAELLDQERLDVPKDLPFDIFVSFNWREQRYEFSGQWRQGDIENKYSLNVPGIAKAIHLEWMPRKKDLHLAPRFISNPVELLSEHRFDVLDKQNVVFRGLVTETGVSFRRSQAFESLADLLDTFIFDEGPNPGDPVPFRTHKSENSELLDDDLVGEVQTPTTHSEAEISLFRLFQASNQYAHKINSLKNVAELNQWVFSRPGCLVELIEKTRIKISTQEPKVFNWFLAQEVSALCRVANKKRRLLENCKDSLPKSRWDELTVPLPRLPKGIQKPYIKLIKRECGYV